MKVAPRLRAVFRAGGRLRGVQKRAPPAARVLVVSASIGGGHVAAGRAIEAELRARGTEASHVDLLDATTPPFRRLYRQAYFDLVRTAPEMVDWLGRRLDRSPAERKGRQARLRARLTRLVSYELPRTIDAYAPDLLLHTHFLPPEILSTLRRDLPEQAVIVTDFVAHNVWLQPGVDRYFVACEEVAVHLGASGVEPERIEVTGIPIDARYREPRERAAARRDLGLEPDRDLALLIASGMERKTVMHLVEQAKRIRWPLTVAVICGRSEELLDDVRRAVASDPGDADRLVTFRPMGFTSEMPGWLAAADLLVGKPGGLTTSEALARGVPFAVVQPYPVQEEGNANYLLENGAGLRIDPLTTFGYKIRAFLEDPARRARMSAAARTLGRPDAATAVVDRVLSDLGGRP